jgi:FixJ family two-component response regulator
MEGLVFVIEADTTRSETVGLVRSLGFGVREFSSAEQFSEERELSPLGCLLLEHDLPGMSGLQLLQSRSSQMTVHPGIMIAAHATVQLAVNAMRVGAVAVLERPTDKHALWDALRNAFCLNEHRVKALEELREVQSRFDQLSGQENWILQMILEGRTNREIAAKLDISTRTVENRRQSIGRKTKTRSLPELLRLKWTFEQMLNGSFPPHCGCPGTTGLVMEASSHASAPNRPHFWNARDIAVPTSRELT